ncbi:DUF1295-domain-containing protein [Flagelloscypha sp. PMI_526]|nr:DUF1295-domain-containing protein [Flagelloscypha sp. PMI_526]
MPGVLSRLLPAAGASYALQSVLALIFVPQANEKFYDFGGAIGFLTTIATSLAYGRGMASLANPTYSFASRQLLLSAMTGLWSARLGTFLFSRAWKAGGDSRFDGIRDKPTTFTFFWMAQATWVFLVGLPTYSANVLPKLAHPPLGVLDFVGVGLFASGWLFEIIADSQKTAWRRKRDIPVSQGGHGEKFITSGLWSWSRHPNYVGEVALWCGIYMTAAAGLYRSAYVPRGFWLVPAISPLFTWFLLAKVSGVPPLERAGNKKFGDDPKWKQYKEKVPVFWPVIGGKK